MELLKGIKSWSEDDRPREKLAAKGTQALSDAELLAILIGSGSRNESAVDLSRRILQSVGNDLVNLGGLSITELQKFKGMGEAKSLTVMAAMELARRRRATETVLNKPVVTPKVAFELLLQHMDNLLHEEFWIITVNRKMQLLGTKRVSEGGQSATIVDIKKVFKYALESNAAGIIVGHNHPSGSTLPSREDDALTRRLRESGQVLDCPLFDHIIVGGTNFYSYAEEGKLSLV